MSTLAAWMAFALAVVVEAFALSHEEALVSLSHGGKVKGTVLENEKGDPFYAFRGIPFAEAPVGELRFKLPVPKSSWEAEGTFDATKDGPMCPQWRPSGRIEGVEDCLMLNVYTPKLPQNVNRRNTSVMIYIHGGGFRMGSGRYVTFPPERLMGSDIVLVTINYRLESLGFLNTGDASSPGNMGLFDQTLAFQWVKDNIEAFGGNPDSVTIFGESTGGSSVSYQLISPKSKGLFHRAIEMSGSALSTFVFADKPMFWAKLLAEQTGCPQKNTSAMVECFRTKPFEELLFSYEFYGKFSTMGNDIAFAPSIDGEFLTAHPRDILKNSPDKVNKVDYMSGHTGMEGAGTVQELKRLMPNVSIISVESFEYLFNNSVGNQDVKIAHMIRAQYLKSIDVTNEFEANLTIAKVNSDGTINMPQYEEVQFLTKAGFDVYMYSYDYAPAIADPDHEESRKYGVGHAEDLVMLFNFDWLSGIPFGENEYKMVVVMTELWSNFAKTGNPDPSNKYLPQWKKCSPDVLHIHHLNLPITVQDYDIKTDEMFKFWVHDVVEARRHKNV